MCGKWHVCRDIRPSGDKSNWPVQRGFEKFYGTITGGGSYYDPTSLCRQNTFITPENDPEYKPDGFYYTDAITDNAIQFLEQHHAESPDKPFFSYVAYTAAHWPMHAREEDIARYRGNYDAGYEPIRKARYEREKKLGLVRLDWPLSDQAGDWNRVQDKGWEARCMEVYAAMIECMDRGIGRIVEQLRESGELDNTIILFLQDNGACAEDMGRTDKSGKPPADLKELGPDDLQPQIWPPMQTRDGRWVRSGPGVMPGPPDTYVAYGKNWANVSNTPFREYKHWVHEGGIATPLIVHWPKGIRASRNGKIESQPGHLIDLMATCVEAGGAKYPSKRDGETIKPMEGASLIPAFNGKSIGRRQPIFWEHEGNRAVREGNWKLVAKENQSWELYDMDKDRSELNNLADKYPRKVERLASKWDAYAQRAMVLPLGAWHGKSAPKKKADEKSGERRD
jgi:arylsulfatase